MFQLWGKIFKQNHLLKDHVVCDDSKDSRTAKVFHSLTALCREFDLAEPIWLDMNIRDFQRRSKTRFTSDNFIEAIDFDCLEIQVIEED